MSYIGLEVTEKVINHIDAIVKTCSNEVIKPKNYHITLAYLGKDLKRIFTQIYPIVNNIVLTNTSFRCNLGNIQKFDIPEEKRTRGETIVQLVESQDLLNIRKLIVDELDKSNIFYDKTYDYNPHVTMFYFKDKVNYYYINELIEFDINHLIIFDDNSEILFKIGLK